MSASSQIYVDLAPAKTRSVPTNVYAILAINFKELLVKTLFRIQFTSMTKKKSWHLLGQKRVYHRFAPMYLLSKGIVVY